MSEENVEIVRRYWEKGLEALPLETDAGAGRQISSPESDG